MSQPPPRPGDLAVHDLLIAWMREKAYNPEMIALLEERHQRGIATYGTPLQTRNGRDAIRDELEELADALKYRMQAHIERSEERALLRDCYEAFARHHTGNWQPFKGLMRRIERVLK